MYRRQDVLFSEAPVNSDRISIFWSTKGIVLGNYVTHIEDSGEERKRRENRKRERIEKEGVGLLCFTPNIPKSWFTF